MRIHITVAALAATCLLTGCSSSHRPDAAPTTPPPTANSTSIAATTPPTTTPAPPTLEADPASPALAHFDATQVAAALNLARQLGRESVSDADLLTHPGPHTDIADYAHLTRYLTPSAIHYLTVYIHDAYRNDKTRANVGGLVFVAYRSNTTPARKSTSGFQTIPSFAVPFTPSVAADVNPTVGLNNAGRMVITGNAVARIPARNHGIRYTDTLTEKFTYYISGTASATATVGVDGWYGYPTATFAKA